MKTPTELIALPHEEACAYIDALTDEGKVTLREAVVDWLVDELGFVIIHGRRRSPDETLKTGRVR